MSFTEKEVTTKNIELAKNHPELVKFHERESKLVVLQPKAFEHLRDQAIKTEQVYISQPTDEFSLRVRKQHHPDGPRYSATLKDRGEVIDGARDRIEVEVDNLPAAVYDYYAGNPNYARMTQHRTRIDHATTIDFIDGMAPLIEVETNDTDERKMIAEGLNGLVEDRTGDLSLDKEAIAHFLSGTERESSKETLDAFSHRIVKEMVAHYVTGNNHVTLGLTGMSGSGKSTVTRAITEKLVEEFGESFRPLVISTDDYHFGKKRLEETYGAPWTAWDDPRTYNTAELANDLQRLEQGEPIYKRHFDFATEEPVIDEAMLPSPFVVIEGLYAGSPDLATVRDIHFEIPTGIATSVGRDVRRLIIENRANRAFPTPESRLRYQLETAIPLYQEQQRPQRNTFSGCMRVMGSRAAMLAQLS